MNSPNTKRIAKNTMMLYFRQILIMLVSLYTVRVVLNVLGEDDYGIYNVVGGVVVLFAFVNNAMADGTQRFLNFALGQKDDKKVNETYSASLIIHFAIAVFFVIAAETIGLWFVNCKLNIPEQRHYAALIVYQLTIVTTVFGIMRVPYNAVVIAYEKMSFFAWLSIVEAVLKLVIVYLLSIANYDKLIFYAFLIAVISVLMLIIYKLYCNRKFETANYTKVSDKKLTKELVSFSGWSLFGATANVCNSQGTNIVLNMFTNVAVNAAMGIANQVNSAIYSFVSNFQMAFKPQLIQLYAAGEKQKFIDIIFKTSKFSFFLLYVIVLPMVLNAGFVLTLWLKNPPEYSVEFVKLILACSLVEAINAPLWMSVLAIGNIRKYQLIVSVLIFLNLPLCIIAFEFGASPEWILKIRLTLAVISIIWRLYYLKDKIQFPSLKYITEIILKCSLIGGMAYAICYFASQQVETDEMIKFIISCAITLCVNGLLMYFIGITRSEKEMIANYVKNKIKK